MADTPTFYLIYGDDDLTIDETIAQIRAELGEDPNAELNTSEFEGENTSVDEILNAVSSFPFLSDRRTVFVRGLVARLTRKGAGDIGKKEMQRLQDNLFMLFQKLIRRNHLGEILGQGTPCPYENP
jgi:hypothetical protein